MAEYEQRLSLEALKKWEAQKYGMFIHFGMSTFTGDEFDKGDMDPKVYNPTELNVSDWVKTASDAGMKYIVLTAKHVAGHCLWPSKYTDYTVANSSNTTDVVYEFMEACYKYNINPGIYYCSWDNHNLFGSLTPSFNGYDWFAAYATKEYIDFQHAQIMELLDTYKGIGEFWVDIPRTIPRHWRNILYNDMAAKNPDMVIVMNNGLTDGDLKIWETWPTDILTIERFLPKNEGYQKEYRVEGKKYYVPGEVCDTLCQRWFYFEDDTLRSDEELLGMYAVTVGRGANMLLDVGPDKTGNIVKPQKEALMRLRKNIENSIGF